ncbi:MAG TPA: SIR2 family protein [Candidatus Acidoferrales bacterium]|nr:SIR2 family protein [Candidatus Acidoferrales bacterium]
MSEKDWELLVKRIRQGRCVPFLGAAANISSTAAKYEGTPLGAEVSKKLCTKLSNQPRDPENLPRVSLHYEVSWDRPDLDDEVFDIIDARKKLPSPLLALLAELPFNLIVTTNYDCLMEQALKDAGQKYRVLVQPPEGFAADAKELLDLNGYDGKLVYKMHGTFGDDAVSSSRLILTEDDYIQFLTTVTGTADRIGVPNKVFGKLSSSSLLFLGYGLEDWDFRILYRTIIERQESRGPHKSYAIQKSPPQEWVKYWSDRRVEIHDYDVYQFATDLRARYFAPPVNGGAGNA